MPATDFITAFGILLRDGAMRDAFAVDPAGVARSLNLQAMDVPMFTQLPARDVEFQADILLRKRLVIVRRIIPKTLQLLGTNAWSAFRAYARRHWPAPDAEPFRDAFEFCRHLRQQSTTVICANEWNRLKFASSQRRVALHTHNIGLQIFIRWNKKRWTVSTIRLGL